MKRVVLYLGLLVWSADSPCGGQERETASEEGVKEAHEPVSRLRAVAMQNNVDFGIGSKDRTGFQLLIQLWQAEVGTGIWWRMKTFSAPVVTADWNSPSGDQWLVPIGGGAGKLVKVGRRGVDLQVSAFYNVIHPETRPHADWTLRIQIQLLFAS